MLRGEIPDCSLPLEDGLLMSRYDSSCFIETKRTQRFFEDVDISQSDLLIFDMDDTLYPERDFVFSGYKAVSAKVFIDFGIDIESRLRCAFESGCRGDIFSKVFNQMNFPQPESYIKELVKVYREQAIAAHVNDELVMGPIDRLVVSQRGNQGVAAEVLDFKTDRLPESAGDESVITIAERYLPQVSAYCDAVCRAFRLEASVVRGQLVFLTAGSVVPVTTGMLVEELTDR